MLPPKNHCQQLKAGILQALNWRLRLNFTLWTGRGYACTYILNKVTARHTKLAFFPEICKLRGFWFGVTWFCAICTRLRWTFTPATFNSEGKFIWTIVAEYIPICFAVHRDRINYNWTDWDGSWGPIKFGKYNLSGWPGRHQSATVPSCDKKCCVSFGQDVEEWPFAYYF